MSVPAGGPAPAETPEGPGARPASKQTPPYKTVDLSTPPEGVECPKGVHSIFDPCPGGCTEPLDDEEAAGTPAPTAGPGWNRWGEYVEGYMKVAANARGG